MMLHIDVNDLVAPAVLPSGSGIIMAPSPVQCGSEHKSSLKAPAEVASSSGPLTSRVTEATSLEHHCTGSSREALLDDAGLVGLKWLDALVEILMQHRGIRERVLVVLLLSCQGQVSTRSIGVTGPDRSQHDQMAAATGIFAPPGAASAASAATGLHARQVPLQDMMEPGGTALDPEAFVVTSSSAMMDFAALSGVAGGWGGTVKLDLYPCMQFPNNSARPPPTTPAAGAPAAFGALDEAPCPTVSRPLQSWQKRGHAAVQVAPGLPMLVAQRLPGVIRR